MSRLLSHIIAFLSVMLLMVSCSTARRGVPVAVDSYKGSKAAEAVAVPSLEGMHPSSKALVSEARGWLGTPYKYGGENHDGVDCSGLVMEVYKKVLDIKLPRSSSEQRDFCSSVAVASLIPGDLLFFATGKSSDKVSHVGIFIGEGKMIHASASRGVIVSDINDNYFVSKFAGAGYVDRYHAMLEPVKETYRAVETNIAAVAPAPAVAATAPGPEAPPEPAEATVAPATNIATVEAAATASAVAEPTVTDARAAVLNSITERKLSDD